MSRNVLLLFSLVFSVQVVAIELNHGWTFSPVIGIANPSLDPIYDHIFRAPFRGQSEIVVDLPDDIEGEQTYPVEDFLLQNELEPLGAAPEPGLEMRRRFGLHYDFVIGVSSWEVNSRSTVYAYIPMQGEIDNQALYERRGYFSYMQYYLGLRYLMFPRKKKYNVFLSMTMNELFDIDYREEHVFDFKTGPATNFSRIFIYEAQTTGPLLGQFALGGEIRLTERFSFSFEGGYAFSIRDGKLSSFNMRNDLNDGDRIQSVPQPFGYDFRLGEVVALSPDGRNRESIKLTLDGWRVASKFSVTF